ncbi:acyl-CoA desaturase 2 [Phthorimaea operculella]|nr:acyl-CoA desaturase 2 [Phthorimaea operculella]
MPGSSPVLANQFVTKSIDDDAPEVETMAYGKRRDYEWQIVWRNVLAFIYLHGAATYGFYLIFTGKVMLNTILFAVLFSALSGMGVTAGAHRLWAHRSYKARWPLRVFLALLQTMAFQNHIYEWVRDHRVHHKFTETDADPHNAKRGFFFSHMGWLMVRKHKAVFEKGANVDMSDLEKDPIVMFQKK